MQFEITSGSDAASHVLFDPTALEPRSADGSTDAAEDAWLRWADRQSLDGRMLHLELNEEELKLKLIVDEPFEPPAPHEKSDVLDGAILRVPAGRLYLAGLYDLGTPDDWRERGADAPTPQHADVPPGTYRVTAFRVEYRIPRSRIDEELHAQLEPGDLRYARAVDDRATPIGCAVVLFAIVGAAAFLFSASTWTWRLAGVGIAAAVGSAALWAIMRLQTSPRMGRFRVAAEAMWKRYPPTVVILRRPADNEVPARFPPARLGGDDADRAERSSGATTTSPRAAG